MATSSHKDHTVVETKIGEYAAAQPCSGTTEVISHVLSKGIGCALPGADALKKKPA